MQRSNPNTFHVAKVHCICHSLVIHPLHALKMGNEGFKSKINLLHTTHLKQNDVLKFNQQNQKIED